MSALTFFRHGTYVKPQYATISGDPLTGPGNSTDDERPDGMLSGVVKRYSKSEHASEHASSFELIKAVYKHAIEYTARPPSVRGMSLLAGVFGAVFGIWVGIYRWHIEINSVSHNVFDSIAIVFPPILIAFGFIMILWTGRIELFCPVDEPIIFDRQHRKIYRIFRENTPGFMGLFKPWPLYAAEYEWNLVDAEHHATLTTTGSTVTRYNSLIFLVRKSASDPTIIDSFNIGSSAELGEHSVPAIWEHIRRFMEENSAALPAGESPAQTAPPKGLLQSVGAVGPFGANYARWWKEQFPFMLLIHVLFPFFVPFFLLWGCLNWLSYKTATPIKWPQEVLTAIEP